MPEAGIVFTVEITVSETAGVETDNFTVNLTVAGTGIDMTVEANGDLSELSGESIQLSFGNLVIDDPGDYNFLVVVDAENADSIEYTESFTIFEPEQIFSPTDEEQLILP